jgi:hypothetical protein
MVLKMQYFFTSWSWVHRRLRVVFFGLGLFCLVSNHANGEIAMPTDIPGVWAIVGRAAVQTNPASITIAGGCLVNQQLWTNAEITLQARATQDADQVQIWGGFRFRDRDSRYVFALRGGNDNDVYLARYAPDGGAEFLGFAPLDFKPVPGIWYRLRIIILGNRFLIFLNDEKLPRINIVDRDVPWCAGRVCLGGGWLPAEFSNVEVNPLTAADESAFDAIGDKHWSFPPMDKGVIRKKQRAEYVPPKIEVSDSSRTEVSLNGTWLFMPDYLLDAGQKPVSLDYDDRNWHVMQVPLFWTPGLAWLYGETSFTNLGEYSMTKGVAESLYIQEINRCDSYTFDWHKTHAAWYRQYLILPPDLEDKHFELVFDAIAKVSEIWVNGTKVGGHVGMFGQIRCDISKVVTPGRNVIAVYVTQGQDESMTNKVEGVAVTVQVTSSMLRSLPHGMYQDNVGGIWQPVKLTITSPVHADDCFVEPGLHGAKIHLNIFNSGKETAIVEAGYSIISVQDNQVLYSNHMAVSRGMNVPAGQSSELEFVTPHLDPKLWSPQDPNLYKLQIVLTSQNQVVDAYDVRFGFRTFAVDGSKLLLNGRPYWLRGANPFPSALFPNDSMLAHRFIEIARAGNVDVTRTHIAPFTTTWLDAADEGGVGVSFEGTWPWLMLQGEPPDPKLLKCWKDEFISLIHENRNHPSIFFWTVNNEMKFPMLETNSETLKKKWFILDDMVKSIRQADPTRPIVADSSYVRKKANKSYQNVVKPNHFDDGDIDDQHSYYGWYGPSFFHFFNGEFGKTNGTPGRPLVSQEMSTGYPNNDDGHPVRFYLFKNYTPQALVGDDAYENADPAIFLKRQAFMTKELAETLRRTSNRDSAGALFFSYLTWFQTPWSAEQIKPWPAYYALKTALQPVLVSAELYGRHFYVGSTISRRVCIINDAENYETISNSQLVWEFKYDGKILSHGRINISPVNYCENGWANVDFKTPKNLPASRVDGQLVLRLESARKILSENNYDVVIATTDWANGGLNVKSNLQLWNPCKSPVKELSGLPVTVVDSIGTANPTNALIIANRDGAAMTTSEAGQLRNFVSRGGRVLILHPGCVLADLFPDQVKAYESKEGEIVTLHIPESPVFSGIEPLDLAWFERGGRQLPIACTGVFQIDSTRRDIAALAWQCDIHGYLYDTSQITRISGTPLLEIWFGKGRLLASEMCFEAAKADPIAQRLLMNAISDLNNEY